MWLTCFIEVIQAVIGFEQTLKTWIMLKLLNKIIYVEILE